jgi:medium-chain acyl-[acyl-carrier-protein] hydrolase
VRTPLAGAPPRVRLLCLPYAGAGPSLFHHCQRHLPPDVQLRPVAYPGREARFRDPPAREMRTLVEAVAVALAPDLSLPFAVFGHSMGALVGFELARLLRARGLPAPVHLFVSGCAAPQVFAVESQVHDLPEAELILELRRLSGTPDAVLHDPELMQLLLPALRADFRVCATYEYREQPPLALPVTAFGGEGDPEVSPADLRGWASQTTGRFGLRMFEGGHFFLHDSAPAIFAEIAGELRPPPLPRGVPRPV